MLKLKKLRAVETAATQNLVPAEGGLRNKTNQKIIYMGDA